MHSRNQSVLSCLEGCVVDPWQGCLRDCLEKMVDLSEASQSVVGTARKVQQQQQQPWAELLLQLFTYLEALPLGPEGRPLWKWLAGALPLELGLHLLSCLPRQVCTRFTFLTI